MAANGIIINAPIRHPSAGNFPDRRRERDTVPPQFRQQHAELCHPTGDAQFEGGPPMVHAFKTGACVVSIVLLSALAARAERPMVLESRLAQPVMKDGKTQRNYLRIALNGCERPPSERTPVNVTFVIDRSGSMAGSRIAQAR